LVFLLTHKKLPPYTLAGFDFMTKKLASIFQNRDGLVAIIATFVTFSKLIFI
jgi:hypothetical protein